MKNSVTLFATLLTLTLSLPGHTSEQASEHQNGQANAPHTGGHSEKVQKITNVLPQPMANTALALPPIKPQIISPKPYDKTPSEQVTLKWTASPGADQYHVQVATDVNFKWLVEDHPFVQATEVTLNLPKGKNYFWRVAAVTSGNVSTHRKSGFATGTFE